MLEEAPQSLFLVSFSFDNETILGSRQSIAIVFFRRFRFYLYDVTQFDKVKSLNFNLFRYWLLLKLTK